ncbi:hypothetical protein SPRG_05365 [Saprolegnia parasitica CBS 223.65]|uniref:Inositol polyphosphate-related phosphatase domain-containing protein n=1 Tax=Saprolegnia parasitica (strain CBS 223.65) TaxID=695850 RepID=A0A067CI67_SAPPC|nr:hypothetical protein SPRG_05365 [Saprolegnia parasitica CBS 223.65]KDO30173.1 hypothetical protein SPRG_05365 [Saprolegnia parasitica CBS 223.65]|eukprot:XP_012199351.1 hypothetical protein SPRG_05365 [Saprolegnia parasitica CBS 223.65]
MSPSSVPCRLWSDDKARGEPSVGVLPLRPILGIGCSVFSVLGCLYIIVTYRIRQSRKVYVDSVGRLVHVLAWLDFVGCVARILLEALKPSNPSQLLDVANVSASPDWFDPNWTAACEAWRDHAGQILCAVLHFSLMGSICWHCMMAVNLYRWVCKGDDQRVLHHRFISYFWCMTAFALLMSVLPYLDKAYDTHSYSMRFDEIAYAVGCHYAWLVLGWFFMIFFLVRVQYDMRQRLGSPVGLANRNAVVAYNDVGRKLVFYVGAYLVFRISNVIDWLFSMSDLTEDAYFVPVLILNNILAPLTGFVNAVIYGGISPHSVYHRCCCCRRLESHSVDAADVLEAASAVDRRPSLPTAHAMHALGHARLFVSSYDLSRSLFPKTSLSLWLPSRAMDIYVLGLINCVDVDDAKSSVLEHLNARFAPLTQYQVFACHSRKALHSTDAPTVQLVFARRADVASGSVAFDIDRQGRSGSRQITGMSLRYFDVAIAFATCSLKPSSEEYLMHRKLAEMGKILQTFSPDVDNPGLDFPHQYHHTILAGNFNFKLQGSTLQERIDAAMSAQLRQRAADDALDAYFSEAPLRPRASTDAKGQHDLVYETRCEMRQSDIIFGLVQSPMGPANDDDTHVSSFRSFLQAQLCSGPPKKAQKSHRGLVQAAKDANDAAVAKWNDVLQCDRLRALMDSNDVLSGFEEPPIAFPPSFPRVLGVGEKNAMGRRLFGPGDVAYADRIFYHSLPGVEPRLSVDAYYLCEDLGGSPHKPICAEFRLEVNRLHTAQLQSKETQHFGFHLRNLDANLWEPPKLTRGHSMRTSSATTLSRPPSFLERPATKCARKKLEKVPENFLTYPMHHAFSGGATPLNAWKQLQASTSAPCECKYCDAPSDDESIAVQSVEPVRLYVVFPLPSVDNFRSQRKIYELAQSVTQGYDVADDAHDDYTNCTEVSWADALEHGVVHTSVTRRSASDAVLHVGVKVEGPRDSGGEGVLALHPRDVGVSRQFDVALTWGGKHTGYLHVDVEMFHATDTDTRRHVY